MSRAKNKFVTHANSLRQIEDDEFPFEFLSLIAERESWRKEVHRPIYHLHKWWAKRLGSIFRGIILGCVLPKECDLKAEFYRLHDLSEISVFDPFMGSGTTVGEAHKLGCTALGRDINPVACESVRVALGSLDEERLQQAFSELSGTVGQRIRRLYEFRGEDGFLHEVLYYFWVKQAPCSHCAARVDLFPSFIFARNAYPDRKPEVQVCCPGCGDIFSALNSDNHVFCHGCGLSFNPHNGPAQGSKAYCSKCSQGFSIADAIRASGKPPEHKLYAKLVLTTGGEKKYLRATNADFTAYHACSNELRRELDEEKIRLPLMTLTDGFNTRQAIGYNYTAWRDFFNDRQLLALGWLQEAIAKIPDASTRDALLLLFSGVLEFNNLFASYKGEGTGAVRHMFAHHILKPERMPIEANVWGTSKSSGSFSTLFKTRLLRAAAYRIVPAEVSFNGSAKSINSSVSFSGSVEDAWPTSGDFKARGIYLSCGSSDKTELPERSIDLVVTDPPFFDNVHYSELADFFFAWQSLYPRGFINAATTTRHSREVQDTDADLFSAKLSSVFRECHRVLKDDGLLVFTYHHSRSEGWTSLVSAIYEAGFSVTNAHPVKSEMSVAAPKTQAKEPIQLDVILICKKRAQDTRSILKPSQAVSEAIRRVVPKLLRLASVGLKLSLNDRRIAIISQFIAMLGPVSSPAVAIEALRSEASKLDDASLSPITPTASSIKQAKNYSDLGQLSLYND